MSNVNTKIGCKYFKYIGNNDYMLFRLKRIKNDNAYIMYNIHTKTDVTMTKEEVANMTRLIPDGYLTLSIVGLQDGIQDVIVTLHRTKDIDNGDIIPYCACRQNIFDLFSGQIENTQGIIHIGCSVSKDTCPANVKYDIVLACNNIIKTEVINVYLDDNLDEILTYVSHFKYDETLKILYNNLKRDTVLGGCVSLKDLLKVNHFEYDFFRAFNIEKVSFKTELNENFTLVESQLVELEKIIKCKILNHIVIPYEKDIDLEKIQGEYLLFSDQEKKVYVLGYVKGAYINREYEALEDKRDRDALLGKGE